MPFTKPNGKRDYLAELLWEHKHKPQRAKQRAERNKARRDAGLKVGDPRPADHIKELVRGGSNAKSNVRVVSARTNLEKEAKRKQRMAKKK
jgi:hypothetical protein